MSDNVAVLGGFTKEVVASNGETNLYLLVRSTEDLDGTFKAWDTDNQEFISVNGWLWIIRPRVLFYWYVGKVDGSIPVQRLDSQHEAEDVIAGFAKTDPDGVARGDYYIDAPPDDWDE